MKLIVFHTYSFIPLIVGEKYSLMGFFNERAMWAIHLFKAYIYLQENFVSLSDSVVHMMNVPVDVRTDRPGLVRVTSMLKNKLYMRHIIKAI